MIPDAARRAPARVPLRYGSLEDAMASARGTGLGVVVDGDEFVLAFTTPFGPCMRRHGTGEEMAFLLRVLSESTRGDYSVVTLACAGDALAARLGREPGLDAQGVPSTGPDSVTVAATLAAFARTGIEIPIHSGRGSSARARSSTIAPCPGVSYEAGAVLRPSLVERDGRCLVRWRAQDGRDAGVHVVIERLPSERERALVAESEARVVSVTPGSMPYRDGTRRVQTLVLDVPHAFATAFPDGVMPRHGIAGAARP